METTMRKTNIIRILAMWKNMNTEYAYTENDEPDMDCFRGYDFVVNKRSICAGSAQASVDVLRNAGVECECAASTTLNHSWNVIKIGSKWYHADFTPGCIITQEEIDEQREDWDLWIADNEEWLAEYGDYDPKWYEQFGDKYEDMVEEHKTEINCLKKGDPLSGLALRGYEKVFMGIGKDTGKERNNALFKIYKTKAWIKAHPMAKKDLELEWNPDIMRYYMMDSSELDEISNR